MVSEADAIVMVVDEGGAFLGTGFLCQGALVTCAHVIEDRRRVRADVGSEKLRRKIAFRLCKALPRRHQRVCDEPDSLCDIAILHADERVDDPLPSLDIAAVTPGHGTVIVRGYVPDDQSDDLICVPVEAKIDDRPQVNGWRLATPFDSTADAPSAGMSGAPVVHSQIDGAVGMLTMGEEKGRALWLMIPSDALRTALSMALKDAEDARGPKFALVEIEASEASQYAYAEIYAPRQKAEAGKGVEVLFLASFGSPPGERLPQLREVDVAVQLPQSCSATDVTGRGEPRTTAMGVRVRWRGRLRDPRWQLSAGDDGSLHERNVALEEPALFRMPDAAAGQRIRLQMMAYANKAYFSGPDLPDQYTTTRTQSRLAQRIIDRLQIKAVREPNADGAIILYETESEVVEAE